MSERVVRRVDTGKPQRTRPSGPSLDGIVILLAMLTGCDRSAAPAVVTPTVAPGPGVVTGVVRFSGARPPESPAQGECCPGVPRPAAEDVVVKPDGTLRDVTVFIERGPNVATATPTTAVLSQRGCRYDPHVFALQVGQRLVVTNGDPTVHNVLVEPSNPANPGANAPEIPGGSLPLTFNAADDGVKFSCSVHPWMRAYATVFDNPCHAVTGPDGAFRIDGLPAGTYTLVAHHEQLGDQRQTVTFTTAKPTADVTFEYHP